MNYAFFGTPEFAAIILDQLITAGFPPALVVCNPDRPVGRKKIITPPPVKMLIAKRKAHIEVWQPEKLTTNNPPLTTHRYDFAVVAAYAKIIPQSVIDTFLRGIIGVHPSLLPEHRGPSPIQSSILAGDKETGVSLFMIDKDVDHGPILDQQKLKFPISNLQFSQLQHELAELGAQLLIQTLPKFVAGEIIPQEQDHTKATFTKKFTSEDGFVAPEKLSEAQMSGGSIAIEIARKIRALNPEPGVWSYARGLTHPNTLKNAGVLLSEKRVKLHEAEIIDDKLVLKKIQMEGKTPVSL